MTQSWETQTHPWTQTRASLTAASCAVSKPSGVKGTYGVWLELLILWQTSFTLGSHWGQLRCRQYPPEHGNTSNTGPARLQRGHTCHVSQDATKQADGWMKAPADMLLNIPSGWRQGTDIPLSSFSWGNSVSQIPLRVIGTNLSNHTGY